MPAFFGPDGSGRIDITRFMSRGTQELMAEAARFAAGRGDSDLDALHLLRVMAEQDPVRDLMRRAGADPATVAQAVESRLPQGHTTGGLVKPVLTGAVRRALLEAHQVARALGSTYIDPEHLFVAFVADQELPAGRLLAAQGVTPQALQAAIQGAPDEGLTQRRAILSGGATADVA